MRFKDIFFAGAGALGLAFAALPAAAVQAEPAGAAAEVSAAEAEAREAFDALIQEITVQIFRDSPEFATYLGLPEAMMGGPYNGKLGDYGPDEDAEDRELAHEIAARLEAVDPAPLDHQRQLTLKLLRDQLNATLAAIEIAPYGTGGPGGYSVYPVTQLSGVHVDLPNLLQAQQPVENAQGAEDYLSRLGEFDRVFAETAALIERDAAFGAIPPDFVLEKTINVINKFTEPAPAGNILYTAFAQKLEDAGVEDRQAYLDRAAALIKDEVYPAYALLGETLAELLGEATHEASIQRLPDGAALYDALIRINADAPDLTGEQIHQIGLNEVARIQTEMNALFDQLGVPEGTFRERLDTMTTDPDYLYPNTDAGRAELLSDLNAQLEEIRPLLPEYFGTIPPQPVEIRRVPVFSQDSAPGGYYDLPSLDGERPGIYWINLRDTAIWPEWSLKTLSYHEAIPGHHFQLALNMNNKNTPLLRKLTASTNAFSEGWALYSERLAKEMGLYEDDPAGDIGRLQSELFRAVRLVVDTGMHAKGWSREKAIEYMVENGGATDRSDAVIEIERYAAWPAQALGYKIGMIKILEMRERAREALGEDFDIREFHDALLVNGGLPLTVMEEEIDRYIETQRAG